MADANQQYNLIYTLGVSAGIKRDGTIFESREFTDGTWCRFQRKVPKKMGGYRQLFASFSGIGRGMVSNAYNGVNYVFVGTENTLDIFTTGTTLGVGSGPFFANFETGYAEFTVASNNTTSFTITTPNTDVTAAFPIGQEIIFDLINPVVYTVTSSSFATATTTVNFTPALGVGDVVTNVWDYQADVIPDTRLLWQFDLQYVPSGGALQLIAHPGLNLYNIDNGIESPVYVGNVQPDSLQEWNFSVLADTGGQNPTYRVIEVDGGVCVLYPFLFVYGSNGFIANNHVDTNADYTTYNAQNLSDWNGPTANQVNMASSKIVRGLPVRGGTNAPSGLFWASDSLIRVSFTGAAPLYWRYDIISSQISIMSSSAVVEMDGIYYWMGVDRFYLYNGNVKVLPNDKNVNWLFDNLNYQQRQKVWATKVPRYNEIWFFYPRGTATECTDAIIYNVKDDIWYDAGEATGAQRSCGYTTEIFPTPIWADWNYDVRYSIPYLTVETPQTLTPPTEYQFYLMGDMTSTIVPGEYVTTSKTGADTFHRVITSELIYNINVPPPGVTLITVTTPFIPDVPVGVPIFVASGGYGIWQHEFGLNKVGFTTETGITSSITTCDISWVGGDPSQDSLQAINRRMHLRRIEPDFVQSGEMTLNIIGEKFARGGTQINGPYAFGPETEKIDLRIEHREIRLEFISNTINGNFEMGRLLITAEYGDERP
jgi:hypothetical protein